MAQLVERVLGKDEVSSSNLLGSSSLKFNALFQMKQGVFIYYKDRRF